jgi:type I restriction-modification system DNA methylase subunit
MPEKNRDNKQNFIKKFNDIARYKHRYDVFRDFVTVSAISLHNAVNRVESLEDEYMKIIKPYAKDEVNAFSELFADLLMMLESSPRDVLGELYMDLELGNKNAGQFFTLSHISELMAQLVYGDELKEINKPFITLSEPTCGAGGMVLAFVKVMLSHGHNPAHKLWVQCVDIDRLAALMCYVQLSLWNVPAQVVVGNSLTLETREVFYTPAHYMGAWDMRLNLMKSEELIAEHQAQNETNEPKIDEPELPDFNITDISKSADIHLDFDF